MHPIRFPSLVLKYHLVKLAVVHYPGVNLLCVKVTAAPDVSRLALHVLAVRHTANEVIELWASVPRINHYGLPQIVAERL